MAEEEKIPSTPDRSVSHYREILLLPLILRRPTGPADSLDTDPEKAVDDLATQLLAANPAGGRWKEIDQLRHMGPTDQDCYQEFLYFHGFIQNFLYGPRRKQENTTEDPWHQRLFERKDLTQIRIDAQPTGGPYKEKRLSCTLDVDRVQLRLFSSGVAIFMVELSMAPAGAIQVNGSAPEDLNLDHLFTLRDAMRRVYPPYFAVQDGELRVREYPTMRQWISAGSDLAKDEYSPKDYLRDFETSPAIPLAPIWLEALTPLIVEGSTTSRAGPGIIFWMSGCRRSFFSAQPPQVALPRMTGRGFASSTMQEAALPIPKRGSTISNSVIASTCIGISLKAKWRMEHAISSRAIPSQWLGLQIPRRRMTSSRPSSNPTSGGITSSSAF